MIRCGFDFKPVSVIIDSNGRYIILKCLITGDPVTIVNVYAPNKETEFLNFVENLGNTLSANNITNLDNVIIGGDWNVIRDVNLDKSGGVVSTKPNSVNSIEMLMSKLNLNDVWRIKNPYTRRYTWRQSSPLIQCRLDYWLISDALFDNVASTDIIPSIRTDHSAITLCFDYIPKQQKGPNFWKFNSSLLSDNTFITGMRDKLRMWCADNEIVDRQLKWEFVKYEIRKFTCAYSKRKKYETTQKQKDLEHQLLDLERNLTGQLDVNRYNDIKNQLQKIDDEKMQGYIIRSKVQWHEEGERSTKYFLGLEKNRAVKKHVQKLKLPNGQTTTNPKQILKVASNYYEKLYSDKTVTQDILDDEILNATESLNDEDKISCEGPITIQECETIVKSFSKNKSPGNDGITAEFYQYFWPEISGLLIDSFNYGYDKQEMSTSQRQAIITLIDKGKDRSYIENWRPISLLNVDYKIASKAIANRLHNLIPKLIGLHQTGFVKGRYINDTIRTLYDIIDYCHITGTCGLLLLIDFEKAFDSLNWKYMFTVLKNMNFGESFINWVRLFYNNVESCISNNGISSSYFKINCGVRQGDPLSSYLFILCVEVMSRTIIQNKNIRGISVGDQELKLLQYADDTTAVLKDEQSVNVFLREVKKFGTLSGLKLNMSKTEAIWLGSAPQFNLAYNIKWNDKPTKVLGVYVGWNLTESIDLTYSMKVVNIRKLLYSWQHRKLTLNGKVLILKSLALSQIIHLLSVLPLPFEHKKEIESMCFEYLWSGKPHKVKKSVIIQDYKAGGIKMVDIDAMNQTQKLKWIKLYLGNHNCLWRFIMEKLIPVSNLNIFLRSNYDTFKTFTKSIFYKEILHVLHVLNKQNKLNEKENLLNQFIFYNKYIKIGKNMLYDESLFNAGLWRVCDLFNFDGTIISFSVWKQRGVTKDKFMLWRGLLSCVRNFSINPHNRKSIDSGKVIMLPNNNIIDIQISTSKNIYLELVKSKLETPTTLAHIKKCFPTLDDSEIEIMYVLPRMCTKDMIIKEFQYKILHRYLPTNELLFKMKKVDTNKCTFCNMYFETIAHIFYECTCVKELLFRTKDVISQIDSALNVLTCKDVILGFKLDDVRNSNLMINNLLLHYKKFIWNCKLIYVEPSYTRFKEYIGIRKVFEASLEQFYNVM